MIQATIQGDTLNHAASAPGGAINWFEPPTADLGASTLFFARALETCLGGGTAAAEAAPLEAGYVAVPDLPAAIACRTATGWRVLTDIIELPAGIGRIAHMVDADGGQVGLHEPGRLA